MQIPTFAVQPGAVRRLRRSIVVVGGTGVAAVVLSTFGGGIMDTAASAALSGGGAYGTGSSREGAVSGMAAAAPVEVGELTEAPRIEASPLQGAVGEPPAAPVPTPAPAVVQVAAVSAPPAAVPPPAPAPAPGTVQAVIAEVFGPHADAAIGVARCESGLNPNAISRGGGNWGLFQINRVHAGRVARMGYAWEDLLDARVNSIVAKSIFDDSGWSPWACRHAAH